ncbi:MAG: hypothetical protein HW403_1433 [Dehalococcoidia bacterium]|nr:hypothetical protein [Dehalococcoidia bacterium]
MDNVFEVTSTKSVNGVIEADSRKRIWGVENMASTHIDTATSSKRIGDLLLEAELLSPECLEKGLQISKERHQRLGEVLVEQGWVDPYHLVEVPSMFKKRRCG